MTYGHKPVDLTGRAVQRELWHGHDPDRIRPRRQTRRNSTVDYIAALTSGSGWQNGGGGATKDMTVHGFILKSGDSLTAALQAGD